MTQLNDATYTILFVILILAVLSYYYLKSKNLWEGNIGIIIISYLQGLFISFLFFSKDFFTLFSSTILVGIMYYLAIPKLLIFLIYLKHIKSDEYHDEKLENSIIQIWNFKREEIILKKYTSNDSFNAFTRPYKKPFEILMGEELLSKLKFNELIFVLSHEIAHSKGGKKYVVYFIVFLLAYSIPSMYVAYMMVLLKIMNIYSYILSSFILMIIGIMIVNYIFWKIEYEADMGGLQQTKDLNSAVSALNTLKENVNDHDLCTALNLIFYDHPPLTLRIEKLKNEFIEME